MFMSCLDMSGWARWDTAGCDQKRNNAKTGRSGGGEEGRRGRDERVSLDI